MIRRCTLYARFSDPDGKYPRIAVTFSKNGKPIEPTAPKGGALLGYQIRIARQWQSAGDNFAAAVDKFRLEQVRLAGGVDRDEALMPPASAPEKEARPRIATAVAEFVAELKTLDRKKYSVAMYENALRDFRKSCSKVYVDQIDRKDVLAFLAWMRQNLRVRVKGSENRTYKNKLGYLGTFLARHGIQLRKRGNAQGLSDAGLLFRADLPKVMKKKPVKYDQGTIDLLLKHADEDQADYLLFLLWSGFRDEETVYLQYSDFNFRASTVKIQAKPNFGWKPKDYEEREITLPTAISKRMKARQTREKAADDHLVFPNGDNRPDSHLIYRLHTVAKKAGINLVGKRGGHMFRKTAGSRVAKKLGLPAAMEFLGHSDLKTTAMYLAADTSDLQRKRQIADEMFLDGD
ncbi:MAG TPA: site-specific integrase [Verrucomicrobiae bacterium]|nr:site-specific integrase [Verrucomicrobiae bacterium]